MIRQAPRRTFKEYIEHFKMTDAFIQALKGVEELSKSDREASLRLQEDIDYFYNRYLEFYNLEYNQEQKEKDLLSILEE